MHSTRAMELSFQMGTSGLNKLDIIPDYTKSVREVYVEFTQKYLEAVQRLEHEQGRGRINSLDYLQTRAAGLKGDRKLPSWAPAFDAGLAGKVRQKFPDDVNKVFGRATEFLSCPDACVDGDSLWVSAVKPITAELISYEFGHLLSDFLDSYGPRYRDGQSLLKVLCCTLFREKKPEYDLDDLQWFLILKDQLTERLLEQILSDGGTMPRKGPNTDALLTRWTTAVAETTGCRFGATMDNYIGLCPSGTQTGDIVCVLLGCSLPAVLRPRGDHYLFVGCCYMMGLMDGEVSEMLSSGAVMVKRIEIQ